MVVYVVCLCYASSTRILEMFEPVKNYDDPNDPNILVNESLTLVEL